TRCSWLPSPPSVRRKTESVALKRGLTCTWLNPSIPRKCETSCGKWPSPKPFPAADLRADPQPCRPELVEERRHLQGQRAEVRRQFQGAAACRLCRNVGHAEASHGCSDASLPGEEGSLEGQLALWPYSGQNTSAAAAPGALLYACHTRPVNAYLRG